MRATAVLHLLKCSLVAVLFSPCILLSQLASSMPDHEGGRANGQTVKNAPRISMSELETLPLQFEENSGQADQNTRFLARAPRYTLFLNPDGATLRMRGTNPKLPQVLSMKLVGGKAAQISGRHPAANRTNYYLGAHPQDWRLGVRTYNSVVYSEVYKGIDLRYHGNGRRIEYDFIVAPQADPSQVRMQFDGLRPILRAGGIAFQEFGGLTIDALKAYQVRDGKQQLVEANWEITGNQVAVRLAPYDHSRELVIDPIFFYGSYIGGSGADAAFSIVNGPDQGKFFVALSTDSAKIDQPSSTKTNPNCNNTLTVCGVDTLILEIQISPPDIPIWCSVEGNVLCVPQIQKSDHLNPTYPSILFAAYVGGTTGSTSPKAMVADGNFAVYVTGSTMNPNEFPQVGTQSCSVSCSGYIAKLDSSLNLIYSLVWPSAGNGIAVDQSGDAYITGKAAAGSLFIPSSAASFQIQAAKGSALASGTHAYLSELSPTGGIIFSSMIGGSGTDEGTALALSQDGKSVFVTGTTSSSDFPVLCSACPTTAFRGGASDIFVLSAANLSTSPALVYSRYLGGSGDDSSTSVAADAAGQAVLVGSTTSIDFPNIPPMMTSAPPFQFSQATAAGDLTTKILASVVSPGSTDGFVTGLMADGELRFTDFLGGTGSASISRANAVVLDPVGTIYVVGTSNATITPGNTSSTTDFLGGTPPGAPTTLDNWDAGGQPLKNNVFFVQIDPGGQNLLQATIAGGTGDDQASSLVVGGYCFASPPDSTFTYAPCIGTSSIVGTTDDASDTGLFAAASTTFLNQYDPPAITGGAFTSNGFFVQEQLAGYCNMGLQTQQGSLLTLTGKCVSGTTSGLIYVKGKSGNLVQPPTSISISGASTFSPTASVSLDLNGAQADQPFTLTFGFLPLGAIGAVGQCTLSGMGGPGIPQGCPIIQTGGGGAGTLFGIGTGTLAVTLGYDNQPAKVPVGQEITLTAAVTNGFPKTVRWIPPQTGTFRGDNPAASIFFTPSGPGDNVVVEAVSVADPTLPVVPLTIGLTGGVATDAPLAIIGTTKMVAGTTFTFAASQGNVTWKADPGSSDASTGFFTAPNTPPNPPTVTVTAISTNPPVAGITPSVSTQVTIVPALALNNVPQTAKLSAGGSTNIVIPVMGNTGIPGEMLSFTCRPTTLPTALSCSFFPNPVTNSDTAKTTLTISSVAVAATSPAPRGTWSQFSLASTITIAGSLLWIRRRTWRFRYTVLAACPAFLCLTLLSSCGTSGSFTSPPQQGRQTGTYTIYVDVQGATSDKADSIKSLASAAIAVTVQ
jgi:hypothetical protein